MVEMKKKLNTPLGRRDVYRPRWHEQRSTTSAEFVKRILFLIADRYMIRSLRYTRQE